MKNVSMPFLYHKVFSIFDICIRTLVEFYMCSLLCCVSTQSLVYQLALLDCVIDLTLSVDIFTIVICLYNSHKLNVDFIVAATIPRVASLGSWPNRN